MQINILEGRDGYVLVGRVQSLFIFIPLSDNQKTINYTNENSFYWEFSFIKIQYVGKDRETM